MHMPPARAAPASRHGACSGRRWERQQRWQPDGTGAFLLAVLSSMGISHAKTGVSGNISLGWRSIEAVSEVIHQHIVGNCTAQLETKDKIRVVAGDVGLNTTNASVVTERLNWNKMLVCQQLIVPENGSASADGWLPSTAGTTAIVTYSDTLSYLLSKSGLYGSDYSRRKATRSKFEYAQRTSSPLFIVLGRLDQLQVKHKSPTCKAGLDTKHHSLKALGMLAVFVMQPRLQALLFLDVDAGIIDMQADPADYLALSLTGQADIIGTSNWREQIVINSGALIVRNTARGRQALAAWWAYRCFLHDQPGLWRAMSEMWPGWEPPKQDERWAQRTPTLLHHLMHNYASIQDGAHLETKFPCDGMCGWLFRKTGCLLEPMELPGSMLLPLLPFDSKIGQGGKTIAKLDALQHYTGLYFHNEAGQFICHTDNRAGKTCRPQSPHRPENTTKEEVQAKLRRARAKMLCAHCVSFARTLQSGSPCVLANNASFIKGCSCETALTPEYTLLEKESKIIARCPSCLNESMRQWEISMR